MLRGVTLKTRNRLITAFSIAAFFIGGNVLAGDIYKWVDENGNAHYVDRPTGQPNESRLRIASRSTDREAVAARVEENRQSRTIANQLDDEAPAEMTREEKRAEQEKREQICDDYRARLEELVQARRLYTEDESGERTYLNEREMLESRQLVEERLSKHCGS